MICRKQATLTLILAAIVVASRLPFLEPGYGTDYDAWLLAEAARELRESGHYVASRPPGYPLMEALLAPLERAGPLATNGLSVLASLMATLLTIALLRRHRSQAAVALGLAFAFTPIVWIASVSTMDYLVAWCLVLSAWHAAAAGLPLRAGLALGLAAGARATSVLMFIPLAWLLKRTGGRRAAWKFGGAQALFTAACYAPVVSRYGVDGLTTAYSGHPGLEWILSEGVLKVWGPVGALVLAVVLAVTVRHAGHIAHAGQPEENQLLRIPAAWTTCIYLALFLVMPYEAAYLIPAAGALLLILGTATPPAAAWLLVAGLSVSAFFGFAGPGPLLEDHLQRVREEQLVEQVVGQVQEARTPSLLLCGPLYSRLRYTLRGNKAGNIELRMAIFDRHRLEQPRLAGLKVLFVNSVDPWHRAKLGYSLWEIGEPILPMDWDRPARGGASDTE